MYVLSSKGSRPYSRGRTDLHGPPATRESGKGLPQDCQELLGLWLVLFNLINVNEATILLLVKMEGQRLPSWKGISGRNSDGFCLSREEVVTPSAKLDSGLATQSLKARPERMTKLFVSSLPAAQSSRIFRGIYNYPAFKGSNSQSLASHQRSPRRKKAGRMIYNQRKQTQKWLGWWN